MAANIVFVAVSSDRHLSFGFLLSVVYVVLMIIVRWFDHIVNLQGSFRICFLFVCDFLILAAVTLIVAATFVFLITVFRTFRFSPFFGVFMMMGMMSLSTAAFLVSRIVVVVFALFVVFFLSVMAVLVAALVVSSFLVSALKFNLIKHLNKHTFEWQQLFRTFLCPFSSWNPPSFSCSPPS